jgi:outer membrane protein assembly factor BamB
MQFSGDAVRPSCYVQGVGRRLRVLGLVALPLLAGLKPGGGQELRLQWSRVLPRRKTAWEYTPRMVLDRACAPAAAGGLVFVGVEHNGALLAFDAATGEERWRFHTEGPIRVGPVADPERVYAASEDGRLYALDHRGQLLWKFRGGPSDRKAIGHERVISARPMSARPVLADGKLFCVSGYWPVDGVSVHGLDAASGKVLWTHPHAQFRPFGRMRVIGTTLFIDGHPSGGAYDIRSGDALEEKPPKPEPAPPETVPAGVEGAVVHRVEDANRLFLSTAEGRLYCFADRPAEARSHKPAPAQPARDAAAAEQVLSATGAQQGYALVAGLSDGVLVEGLLRKSELHVVAVDPDPAKADRIRRNLDARGCFDDHRLTILAGDPAACGLPPYFASVIVSESEPRPPEGVRNALRPYGGAWVEREGAAWRVTRREGPPPGADDWTHEYHDAANTLASRDALVRAPLGALWYGGPAADVRYYYDGNVDHQSGHGINPQPTPAQIVEGRMVLQGPGVLAAFDIYTGRRLWEAKLPGVYTFGGAGGGLGIHSKNHPEPWRHPEALKAEVPPNERCRSSGFDMLSLPDAVYVGAGRRLLRFDPRDGRPLSSWAVPIEAGLCWGNLRSAGDLLVATVFRPKDMADAQAGFDGNGGDWAGDRMPMAFLVALDRHSGKLAWSRAATWGFVNRSGVVVGSGKVFCADLLMEDVLKKFVEAGRKLPSEPPSIFALDLATGKELWMRPIDVLVKALAYSEPRDLLVAPCRNLAEWKDGRWDRRPDAKGKFTRNIPGRMRALRGADGSVAWEAEGSAYFDPHIVLGDLVVDRDGFTYDLATGKRNLKASPLTGEAEPWSFRKGGCNYLIAGPNLVTWRCAFYDLAGGSGVMKLTGMDAGCSPTLIPAGGVLNIPNFGTHHKRNRMTAMALVHAPENALWTDFLSSDEKAAKPVPLRRAGFRFGAPGDRISEDGTVWFGVRSKAMAEVRVAPREVRWPLAGGIEGATTVSIPTAVAGGRMGPLAKGEKRRFTVRLHLGGGPLLNVSLEGRAVLRDVGGKPEVHEIKGVEVEGALDVGLEAVRGATLLSAVEVVLE